MKTIIIICLTVCCSGFVNGQDVDRKWALRFSGVVSVPVITKSPSWVSAGSWSGSGPEIDFEYYLPCKTSVHAGYFQETNHYFGGDAGQSMKGLTLGARKYFVKESCFIQPFAGLNTFFSFGDRHISGEIASFTSDIKGNQVELYRRNYVGKNPVFSVAPAVGFDLYIFSCIAFTVEYNFRMGIGSTMDITTNDGYPAPWVVSSKGMRHDFTFGVKVAFPLRFTSGDGEVALNSLVEILFNDCLWRPSRSRKSVSSFVY